MLAGMDTSACTACAKARRRCGRQKPHCLRCRARGADCCYPARRPSSFVVLEEQALVTTASLEFSSPALSSLFSIDQTVSSWLASPQTWTVDAAPSSLTSNPQRFSSTYLDHLLAKVIAWMNQWTNQGSNPFIHRELYQYLYPPYIQDAYILLSCYFQKTVSNQHMISRIIEDRVTSLVSQGIPPSGSTSGHANTQTRAVDALEHIARVQALLVYQCVSLYDGDVRLRHLADKHMPVLRSWLSQMLEHNSWILCCGRFDVIPFEPSTSSTRDSFCVAASENLLWHFWILTESTRRTWLIAGCILGVYELKQNRITTCLGVTMFTSRQRFWEAPSATAWEERCCEVYAGLAKLTEVNKIIATIPLDEMDEFAKLILQCTYGVDQAERWGIKP